MMKNISFIYTDKTFLIYLLLIIVSVLAGFSLLGSTLAFFGFIGLALLCISLISPYSCLLLVVFTAIVQPGVLFPNYEGFRPFMLIAGVTAVGWLSSALVKHDFVHIPSIQNKLIIFLVLFQTLSVIQYFWMQEIIGVFWEWTKFALIYFMIIHLADSVPKLKGIMWTVVIAVAVIVFKAQYDQYFFTGEELAIRLSAYGKYGNANDLALAIVLSWPISYKLWEAEKIGFRKIILLGILVLYTLSIALTASRGGLIGFAVVATLSIITSQTMPSLKRGLILIPLVLAVFTVGMYHVYQRTDVVSFLGGDQSAERRLDVWTAGLQVIKSNPLTGVGNGHFIEWVYHYGAPRGIAAHNTFVKVGVETGIPGLLTFVLLLYIAIKRSWIVSNSIKEMNQFKILAQAYFIILIGFLVNTMFSNKESEWILYIILAGSTVIWNIYKKQKINGVAQTP